MKVFISWSGETSQQIARELHRWFPLILPSAKLFLSVSDIEKGAKWQTVISRELAECTYGLACLTRDSVESQWVTFEGGALSKFVEGRVATLLFNLTNADVVRHPLGQFQSVQFVEEDFRRLVNDMNAAAKEEERREQAHIDKLFATFWPELKQVIDLILQGQVAAPQPAAIPGPVADTTVTDMLSELLILARQQSSVLTSPEKFLAPALSALRQAEAAEGRTPPVFLSPAVGGRIYYTSNSGQLYTVDSGQTPLPLRVAAEKQSGGTVEPKPHAAEGKGDPKQKPAGEAGKQEGSD